MPIQVLHDCISIFAKKRGVEPPVSYGVGTCSGMNDVTRGITFANYSIFEQHYDFRLIVIVYRNMLIVQVHIAEG